MTYRDYVFLGVLVGCPIVLAFLDIYFARRDKPYSIIACSVAACVVAILIWLALYKGSDFAMDPRYDGPRPYSPQLHEHIWSPLFYFGLPAVAVGISAVRMRSGSSRAAHLSKTLLIGILSLVPAYLSGIASLLIATGYRGF
jgi:hypothetical protein